MARIRLTQAAKASLKSIGRYTEEKWGRDQRNAYLRALDASLRELLDYPMKGRSRDEIYPDLRSCSVKKHVVFYLPKPGELVIVDILHQHMDPASHLTDALKSKGH